MRTILNNMNRCVHALYYSMTKYEIMIYIYLNHLAFPIIIIACLHVIFGDTPPSGKFSLGTGRPRDHDGEKLPSRRRSDSALSSLTMCGYHWLILQWVETMIGRGNCLSRCPEKKKVEERNWQEKCFFFGRCMFFWQRWKENGHICLCVWWLRICKMFTTLETWIEPRELIVVVRDVFKK